MGQQPRQKPKRLAAKLLAIRRSLGMSQGELARAIDLQVSAARISEYEHGTREPNLITLLVYSKTAHVHLEQIVDDKISLTRFRDALIKEIPLIEKAK